MHEKFVVDDLSLLESILGKDELIKFITSQRKITEVNHSLIEKIKNTEPLTQSVNTTVKRLRIE